MKIFLQIFILIFCTGALKSQELDTIWHTAFSFHADKENEVVSQRPFMHYRAIFKCQKNSNTILFKANRKYIHSLSGNQLGIDFYRKIPRGYYYIFFYGSTNPIYPKVDVQFKWFKNIFPKLEFNFGGKLNIYHSSDPLYMLNTGITSYLSDWTIGYQYNKLIKSTHFQRVWIRRSWGSEYNFIEAFISSGAERIEPINQIENLSTSTSFGIRIKQRIDKKVNIYTSLTRINYKKSDQTAKFTNVSIGAEIIFR